MAGWKHTKQRDWLSACIHWGVHLVTHRSLGLTSQDVPFAKWDLVKTVGIVKYVCIFGKRLVQTIVGKC